MTAKSRCSIYSNHILFIKSLYLLKNFVDTSSQSFESSMFLAIVAFVLTIDTAAGAAPSIAADGETLALLASKVVIDTGSR